MMVKRSGAKRSKTSESEVALLADDQSPTNDDDSDGEEFNENGELVPSSHKKQLAHLASQDPEFYKFLKEQDADLLQFDESDEEIDEDEQSVGVDESDSTNGGLKTDSRGRQIVNYSFVEDLEKSLNEETSRPADVRRAIGAFTACVARVGADVSSPHFVVNDEKLFENIVRLCFTHLGPKIYALLGPETKKSDQIPSDTSSYTHYKRWNKYNALIKIYLHSLILFLNELQTPSVMICTLSAVTELLNLYIRFPKLTRNMSKALVRIWSRKTDDCRCSAFIAICKLVRINQQSYNTVLKWCYFGYVSNTRSVTADSWPLITFMQKSFAELCMIYPEIAYQYIFVYIRQTAIHLRNAMIAKRKDLIQTIYNWQFIQCLYIWSRVTSTAHRQKFMDDKQIEGIRELVYPLCQIVITAMKLFPSLKYFPLRLHCLRILLILQVNCKIYIPTLALAVELLNDVELMVRNKPKKGKGAIKGVDIKCMLKATSQHLTEVGYRVAALDELFKMHLEAVRIVQSSCAFPDMIVPLESEIKAFVKRCKNVEYAQLFKSLNSILKEHAKLASQILDSCEVDLNNHASLAKFTAQMQAPNTPFTVFYKSWQNVWKLKREALKSALDVQKTAPALVKKIAQKPKSVVIDKQMLNDDAAANNHEGNFKRKKSKDKRSNETAIIKSTDEQDVLEDLVLDDIDW